MSGSTQVSKNPFELTPDDDNPIIDAYQRTIDQLTQALADAKTELAKTKAELQVMSEIGSEERYTNFVEQRLLGRTVFDQQRGLRVKGETK